MENIALGQKLHSKNGDFWAESAFPSTQFQVKISKCHQQFSFSKFYFQVPFPSENVEVACRSAIFHFSFPSAISKCQLVEVPEVIEPKTSVLILPKDIKPEEVIRLADSLPVENITIIVGSTPIVQNQAIQDLKQEQVENEVLDAADDFKSSIDLKNTIDNVHNDSSDAPVLLV